jgi:hypothetical protein
MLDGAAAFASPASHAESPRRPTDVAHHVSTKLAVAPLTTSVRGELVFGHVRATLADPPPPPPPEAGPALFAHIADVARELETVHIAAREFQLQPVMVFGNPGVAMTARF